MPTLNGSYTEKGHNYYKYNGRYKETTTASIGLLVNNASLAKEQKILVTRGSRSASFSTLDRILRKKGLIK
jgi:hypothetical protein